MKIIGIYRKCDLVTLTGAAFAVSGIILSINGLSYFAIICLISALLCDGFDGVIARKSNSLDYETAYGVELDSICDVISFGVLPVVIVQNLTDWNIYTSIISVIFCLCGIIRLAYFNMLATTKKSDGKSFIGFPIVISACALPLAFFILTIFKLNIGNIVYPIVLLICGILYVVPIKLRKLSAKERIILTIIGIIFIGILSYLYYTYK